MGESPVFTRWFYHAASYHRHIRATDAPWTIHTHRILFHLQLFLDFICIFVFLFVGFTWNLFFLNCIGAFIQFSLLFDFFLGLRQDWSDFFLWSFFFVSVNLIRVPDMRRKLLVKSNYSFLVEDVFTDIWYFRTSSAINWRRSSLRQRRNILRRIQTILTRFRTQRSTSSAFNHKFFLFIK